MRKNLLTMLTALLSIGLYAQVGIGTDTPRATLDVQPGTEHLTSTATTNEGIIPPKISKTRLAQIANDKLVEGTIVYIDNVSYTASPTNVKVGKVTEKGYYVYSGSSWQPLSTNIYNQNGRLTGDRSVDLNSKNLNFAGGKIGRNIREPRSAVDLGEYTGNPGVYYIGSWNNGLIPPRMDMQYIYDMGDDFTDGTIVYLSDTKAPSRWDCTYLPITGSCISQKLPPKPQMSEMTKKGLYIWNKEADKWLPLKSGKKHSLVPFDQINRRSDRTTITGTSGSWNKVAGRWVYTGLVFAYGDYFDNKFRTQRGVSTRVFRIEPWMDARAGIVMGRPNTDTTTIIQTLDQVSIATRYNRAIPFDGIVVERLERLVPFRNGKDPRAGEWYYTNFLDPNIKQNARNGALGLVKPVEQFWYYDE